MPRQKNTNLITPAEAGKMIGKSAAFVQRCLRCAKFPVGFAEQNEDTGRWTYIIPRAAFMEWLRHYQKTLPVTLFDNWLSDDTYIIPRDDLKRMLLGRTECNEVKTA